VADQLDTVFVTERRVKEPTSEACYEVSGLALTTLGAIVAAYRVTFSGEKEEECMQNRVYTNSSRRENPFGFST
jgi:hypothetical protein